MTESSKHKIIGGLVLVALLALFAPLLFKNTRQLPVRVSHREFNLPRPPSMPVVQVAESKQFVAKPQLAAVNLDKAKKLTVAPKATAVTTPVAVHAAIPAQPKIVARKTIKKIIKHPRKRNTVWSVQLAVLSQQKHVKHFMYRIKHKGYKPFTHRLKNKKGLTLTTVFVGREAQLAKAKKLRNELNRRLKIRGILKKTVV